MAREANIQASLTIRKSITAGGLVLNRQHSHAYQATVTGTKGPSPGAVLVPLVGVDIDLSQLTQPGWCWIKHLGLAAGTDPGTTPEIYYIDIGIKDILSGRFLPFMELQPGGELPFYFSRNLLEAYNQTGTGTGPANNTLHAIAYIAACNLSIEAYEA